MKWNIIIYVLILFVINITRPNISFAQGTWVQKTSIGTGTYEGRAGFSIGNKGYVGTGMNNQNRLWEWDQSANTWTQKANLPSQIFYRIFTGFSIGNKGYWIFMPDVMTLTLELWEWDQAANTWTKKSDFPGTGRFEFVSFSIGNKGYIGTGGDGGTGFYKDFWEWDQATNNWSQNANFGGSARFEATGFSIGNKGYIGTGVGTGGQKNDFWEYDQSANAWVQKANFPGPARENATGFSIGCKGYIGLGNGPDAPPHYKDFYEYDPATDTWTQIANFGGAGREYAAGFSIGCKGYIASGQVWWDSPRVYFDDLWEYSTSDSANVIVVQSDISCNGGNDGTASVTVSGGCSPYTYLWSNGQTDSTATGLSAGTYSVTVSFGCDVSNRTVTITQPPVLTASLTATSDCGNGASATASPGGGTSPYTYSWSTTPVQTVSTATGLSAGNYSVTITDSNSCFVTQSVTVSTAPPFTASILSQTNVSCSGGNNGSASLTVNGGTSPYTYSWNTSPVQSTATATGLSAGNYSVTVTDANGCNALQTISITQPGAVVATISSQANVSCSGGNDGSAAAGGSGGISPYTYSWNTFPIQITATATGLSAGNYSVTVTDANGCAGTQTVSITQPPAVAANISSQANVSCSGGNNGSATASGNGGTSPYTYSWNTSPAQVTATATGLSAGNYLITVTDANNCAGTQTVSIAQPAAVAATISSQANVSCSGGNNGSATVSGSGGTLPYTYSWNTSPVQTTAIATGLSAGNYSVTVTDVNGCTGAQTLSITQPTTLVVNILSQTNVSCSGGNDGNATVSGSGGTSPYTYGWNTLPPQSGATATGLSIGNYSITVTDINGCTGTQTVSITQPPAVAATILSQANVSCSGGNNGSATASGNGGTSPYTYSWNTSPAQVTATATGLSAGNYLVTVTDANNCAGTQTVSIAQPAAVAATISSQANVSCSGGNNGSATVSGSGGTLPYTYSWNTSPVQTTAIATGLSAGNYSVTVSDSNNCLAPITMVITEPGSLTVTISGSTSVCEGQTATLSVSASGGTPGYTYLWSPGNLTDTSISIQPVTSANYSISLTDINGCNAFAGINVTVNPKPVISFTAGNACVNEPVIFNNSSSISSGSISSYYWNFGDSAASSQQNPSHAYDSAGTYAVQLLVTSDSGCTDSLVKQVLVHPLPLAAFSSTNNCLYDTSFFNNTSAISNGNINGWNWSFGDGNASSLKNPYHLYDSAGLYTVTLIALSDSGCSDTTTSIIEKHPVPVTNFTPDTVCFNDSTQFTDLSTITTGSVVGWVWNFGDGTPVINQQNPYHYFSLGAYNVTLIAISDKGCFDDSTKQVGVYPLPIPAFGYGNSCINEQPVQFSDSSFVQGGTITSWLWNFGDGSMPDTSTLPNPSHSYSNDGTYTVELLVLSDKGCSDTLLKEIEIFPLPQIDFTADTTAGCEPLCVYLSDNSTISPGNINTWNWNFGNGTSASVQNPNLCFEQEGFYSVSLIAASDKNCKDTLIKNNYITVYPLPVADFYFSPESTTVQDMEFFFTDLSGGQIAQWEWLFYDNDSSTLIGSSDFQNSSFNFAPVPNNPFVFFLEDTGYYPVQLIVTTVNGCQDTIIKKVRIEGVFYVNIPNAFTPNGDGRNDFFFPKGIGIEPYRDFNFFIFNRWGDLIFESHNLDVPWDGTYNGEPVQQDVYVWTIVLRDIFKKEHRYVGHVTMMR